MGVAEPVDLMDIDVHTYQLRPWLTVVENLGFDHRTFLHSNTSESHKVPLYIHSVFRYGESCFFFLQLRSSMYFSW